MGGSIRKPVVAGRFYPGGAEPCRAQAQSYLAPVAGQAGPWRGAVVPHAGWVCSGSIAGKAIATLAAGAGRVDVVVVFGAVHTPIPIERAAFDSHDGWSVPLGQSPLSVGLRAALGEETERFTIDDRFHEREHAIEVELPLVQLAWPGASILPLEVPALDRAVEIGRSVARRIAAEGLRAVYLASSDLTHYGPAYGFTPAGVGEPALGWALDNDRRLLAHVETVQPERVVPEAVARFNACGAGAIAAMLSTCREQGATRGVVLEHTNSFQTLQQVQPQAPTDAVGYAAIVVG